MVHVVGRMMRIMSTEAYLNEAEQFSLLVAAIGHDVGHPGVNNGFLCEVGHEVALLYNDRSCLENMHCAKLFSVLSEKDTNLFGTMSREQFKAARQVCIDSILTLTCHVISRW